MIVNVSLDGDNVEILVYPETRGDLDFFIKKGFTNFNAGQWRSMTQQVFHFIGLPIPNTVTYRSRRKCDRCGQEISINNYAFSVETPDEIFHEECYR